MRVLGWVFRECWFRKWNVTLNVIGLATAVAVTVAFMIAQDASERETRRITRDIGFNLRIVPRGSDMEKFWLQGYSDNSFDEAGIDKLAATPGLSYNHLVATLQQRIEVEGNSVLLTGLADEVYPPGQEKPDMNPGIDAGTAHVGYEIARRLKVAEGDEFEVAGNTLTVVRAMPESGSIDDLRIITTLDDAQQILEMPGRINEIKAIDCLCLTADENPLGILREQLSSLLPDAEVVMLGAIADARAKQRQMSVRYSTFVISFLLVAAAVWVASLSMMNVRQRESEIGLLRALGYGGTTIGSVFLGRAITIGLLAAVVGYFVGSGLAGWLGPDIFRLTSKAIRPDTSLLVKALLWTPLFSAGASLIPMAVAITRDPATILRQE